MFLLLLLQDKLGKVEANMMNPYVNTYKTQQVQTASKEQLLVMLYEGAIRFLNLAKTGIEENNFEKYHTNIAKTQRILLEFMSTLDLEVGGEMAQNLFRLYEYLHYQLLQANLKKDVSMVDEVLMHLRELKQTWEEAIGIINHESNEFDEYSGELHSYSA